MKEGLEHPRLTVSALQPLKRLTYFIGRLVSQSQPMQVTVYGRGHRVGTNSGSQVVARLYQTADGEPLVSHDS